MSAQDFYARLDAIEEALFAIRDSLPSGQEPDATIIAHIHCALAADLPGLISRVGKYKTAESEALTRHYSTAFKNWASRLTLDGVDRGEDYAALIAATERLYRDILQQYS